MIKSLRLKKVHVNGIRVVGIVGFIAIFFVIITVPNIGNVDVSESFDIVPQSAEDILNEAKGIGQYSVVDTDIIFTESNDSILQQFLDSQNIDSPLATEKFGVEIQTALFDSNGNKSLNSTTFGIAQLSVTDEQGRLLDLGSIQTSFLGFTRNMEKSTNIWGTVKFYLDDDLIDTKRIWASSSNQQKTPLFLVSSLSFVEANIDYARLSEIDSQINSLKQQISVLKNEIISLGEQTCTNCSVRDTELKIKDERIDAIKDNIISLNAELSILNSKIDNRLPVSPSFSDRKTNFTFTLSDEGRNWTDKSEHYYRVVLTKIHANIDSDKNFKVFSWSGENIVYELKVKVDESKIVRFDSVTNESLNIFKSDGTFSVTSPINNVYSGSSFPSQSSSVPLPVSFELFVKSTGRTLGVIDNKSFVPSAPSTTYCGGYPKQVCNSTVTKAYWNNPIITNMPRGTDLQLKSSDGNIFEFKTSESQKNYYISCNVSSCTSNFGYSR